ncbi:SDR family oxidoreductase [Natronospirillum operosum]|uniref:SDR family oxidoreductase n=1 Tax=Natronospirillum operosum TaxID=2759953 RepID=A0A4Z0WDS9_9GAMM|nr:coniferyl-alcohol dehydrogenase [Natronospirillum operosum]TGG93382.1 SDR family oxidoreductase [Natronospirillum operosum]
MSAIHPQHLLQGKTIVVTGCASGIGLETARLVKYLGGDVLGVDVHKTTRYVDELYRADLSDRNVIDALVEALPNAIDGLANIAGLPPTAPAAQVLKVNLVGLRYLTESLIPKLANGASIVNLASLAGMGWPESVASIRAAETLDFDQVEDFVRLHGVGNEGGRSYFFSKEALIAWTMKNRWTWRERGIRMNAVSPGPVDTPILGDFIETLGERAAQDMAVMDRPGRPEDIAPVVAFLLSDLSTWIRGTNLPADGGMASHLLGETHGL